MRIVQITDTHLMKEGALLYGTTDTFMHLQEVIAEVNSACPKIDCVLMTGDLVEVADRECYQSLKSLISNLKIPTFLLPGNHDDPVLMAEVFSGDPVFPVTEDPYQYTLEDFDVRILMLNTYQNGTELPLFDDSRLNWLEDELGKSDKPTLIAIHHPPMVTGISFVDMAGSDWFEGLGKVISENSQVKLVICGHAHSTLTGRLGGAPVYMASSSAYQLASPRGLDIAPVFVSKPASPVLHVWEGKTFRSGPQAWPINAEDRRIDALVRTDWDALKKSMRGET